MGFDGVKIIWACFPWCCSLLADKPWSHPSLEIKGTWYTYIYIIYTHIIIIFFSNFYKGNNCSDFLLVFLHTKRLWKGVFSKREEFVPNSVSLEQATFPKGGKTILTELPPLKVNPFPRLMEDVLISVCIYLESLPNTKQFLLLQSYVRTFYSKNVFIMI